MSDVILKRLVIHFLSFLFIEKLFIYNYLYFFLYLGKLTSLRTLNPPPPARERRHVNLICFFIFQVHESKGVKFITDAGVNGFKGENGKVRIFFLFETFCSLNFVLLLKHSLPRSIHFLSERNVKSWRARVSLPQAFRVPHPLRKETTVIRCLPESGTWIRFPEESTAWEWLQKCY